MTIFDHLFVLIIAVAQPTSGYLTFNKLVRQIEAGKHVSITHLYNTTMAGHWLLFVVLLAAWSLLHRSWGDLGFGLNMDTGFLAGVVLTIAAIVFLGFQLRKMDAADSAARDGLRGQLGKLELIFPRNNNELNRFYAVSVTAGIVEETIWRGFMFWYLAHFMPIWGAAIVSTIGFGLAHAYQGAANVPKVILVGAVFAGLYMLTGSLWLPMVLHAIFDIVQGRAVYGILNSSAASRTRQNEQ